MLTGKQEKPVSNAPSYTRVFADALLKEAAKDEKICAVTAAMPDGTGLNLFAERYPSRCFDVGIAEQHGVTFSAGLAAGGMKPFCAFYSTFLQRGYDQIVHDVALQGLPVRFAIDRAGYVGADGATHAGSFDIAITNLPGIVVMAAADEAELVHMVATAPLMMQVPSPSISSAKVRRGGSRVGRLQIGKGRLIKKNDELPFCLAGRVWEMFEGCEKLRVRIPQQLQMHVLPSLWTRI